MNKKKNHNIAILIPGLNGGGAEKVAALLSIYFEKRGWNVYYFVDQRKRGEEYFHKGKVIQVLPECENRILVHSTNLFYQFHDLLVKGRVIKTLKRQYQIDIAISFMDEYNLLNVLSKRKEKVILRICDIMSLSGVAESVNMNFPHRVIGYFYNKADKIVVMSEFGKRDMIKNYHILPEKLIKISNPLNERTKTAKKENEDWGYGSKVILAMGRVVEIKQHEQLIKIMPYVLERCNNAKLLIVGASHGSHSESLKKLVADLKLEKVVCFTGHQTNVNYYYQNSRVFALVSKSEGYPNVMIEALAEGIPVVAADCPGAAREILGYEQAQEINTAMECKNGVLVPELRDVALDAEKPLTQSQRILADAILKVLTQDSFYNKYKDCARDDIKRLELDDIGDVWISYF